VQHGTEHALRLLNFEFVKETEDSSALYRAHNMPRSGALPTGLAEAQTVQIKGSSINSPTGSTPPEAKGHFQPQGRTRPIDTFSGGAPADNGLVRCNMIGTQRNLAVSSETQSGRRCGNVRTAAILFTRLFLDARWLP
jgi:hypothetical protein